MAMMLSALGKHIQKYTRAKHTRTNILTQDTSNILAHTHTHTYTHTHKHTNTHTHSHTHTNTHTHTTHRIDKSDDYWQKSAKQICLKRTSKVHRFQLQ